MLCLIAALARSALAVDTEVVMEIDATAERTLDARSARRLVALELADVDVPASAGTRPALFFRVLGRPGGFVRVELWERGELHDARVFSTAEGSVHLVARRVALAAAELARGLRQRRLAEARREARELSRLREASRLRRLRTREGPLAVRPGLGVLRGDDITWFGESLALELTLSGPVRLDLGVRALGGEDERRPARLSTLEGFLGPARRFRLSPALDLDIAASIAPMLVHVAGAEGVDGVTRVRETWSAKGTFAVRVEPRLSRAVRAYAGAEASMMLRTVLAEFATADERRYRGFLLGGEIGLVVTP